MSGRMPANSFLLALAGADPFGRGLHGQERRPVCSELFSSATPHSPRALLRSACPIRVWNGIFAARDWRAKRGLKTMSPRRDRKSETTTREKWPQKGLSANELSVAGFGRLGGG